MATLVLSTIGNAVGTAIGGPVGGMIGHFVGSLAGAAIDGSGRKTRFVQGPRLSDVSGLSSTEGDPVPRLYGRARIGGSLIWATRPLEVANTDVERAATPAKGMGGQGQRTVKTTYAYFANLAVGLCEGEIAFVRRIWADGTEIDQTKINLRVWARRALLAIRGAEPATASRPAPAHPGAAKARPASPARIRTAGHHSPPPRRHR